MGSVDDLDGGSSPDAPKKSVDKTTLGVLVALVAVLVVAAIGVATVRDAKKTIRDALSATTTTVPGSTPPPPHGGADGLSAEQRAIVDEVKVQVAAIRRLPWKRDLPVQVVSRDELSRKVKALSAEDLAENRDDIVAGESVLKLLQLVPRSMNYVATIEALSGAVLGFYDDETKELYVGGAGEGTLDVATRSVLAHELTHALTDQHFDFGVTGRALEDQDKSEEASALSAVIEGDAELVAVLWEETHLSDKERAEARAGAVDDGGAYDQVPPYVIASLRFPYDAGLAFVRSRHRAGGFAEVDNAYRRPPVSTEQILHPELYAAGQGWFPPPIPDLAAATGCGKVDAGALGEFDMGQVLDIQLSADDARRAAAGWNGDSYAVVRCGTALGLADRWQTDNPADAGRLAEALARWSRGWSGSSRGPDAEGRFSGPKGAGRLSQSPGRVDLVLADDVATADRLARALLAA